MKQKMMLIYSVCILVLSVIVFALSPKFKKIPKVVKSDSGVVEVKGELLKKQPYTVRAKTFGYAKAKNSWMLKSPFAGLASPTMPLSVGIAVPADNAIFTVEKDKILNKLEMLTIELENYKLSKMIIASTQDFLRQRLEFVNQQLESLANSISQQQECEKIEEELFANSRELFGENAISNSTLIQHKQKLLNMKLKTIEITNAFINMKIQAKDIEKSITVAGLEEKQCDAKIHSTISSVRIAEIDLKRSYVSVEKPVTITEIFIDSERYVNFGEPLATVSSLETIEIEAALPDIYLRSEKSQSLFSSEVRNLEDYDVDICAMNVFGKKEYLSGKISGVGNIIDKTTRSLPIFFIYNNYDKINIFPGMYCRVEFDIYTVDDAFRIPKSALQSNGEIVIKKNDNSLLHLTNFDILDEEEGSIIVSTEEGCENDIVILADMSAIGKDVSISPVISKNNA